MNILRESIYCMVVIIKNKKELTMSILHGIDILKMNLLYCSYEKQVKNPCSEEVFLCQTCNA